MGLVKEKLDFDKLRGGYYTPKELTRFICQWAINEDTNSILEPSCGDGNFIEDSVFRLQELGVENDEISRRLTGIELIPEEADKAVLRAFNLGLVNSNIINSDFFEYIENTDNANYDTIIGNPPFIRYQNFPEVHRTLAIDKMKSLGLNPNKLTNIWVPFLVISASLLSDNGKLGMVIPVELFQVKYAAETRVFLSNFFERITIVTFKKLVFKGIQQEVVILLCEKQVENSKGIRVIECENLDSLTKIDFNEVNKEELRSVDHSSEKWTKYFLTEEEIQFLRRLKADDRTTKCEEYINVDVGIVTGRNEFFMLKNSQVNKWGLNDLVTPVTSKSKQLKGITFTEQDYAENGNAEYSINLFLPPNDEFENLPQAAKDYIKYGEKNKFHEGYKCRIRKNWYITPSMWQPDGFALRQIAAYPKIILNQDVSSSTDTIHRVRFNEGVDGRLFTISFLNSLSFAFSEITGRSYGGGVMTFEPTEIEEIQIPRLIDIDVDFDEIDKLIRSDEIEKVLDIVDENLLVDGYGFSWEEVRRLRGIWRKLSNRRLYRKKK